MRKQYHFWPGEGGSLTAAAPLGEHGRWRLSRQVQAVSIDEARQMAIASQLLSGDETCTPRDVLRHLGAIQLDAMQRVDKSHRLVCFARIAGLGGREAVDRHFWVLEGNAAAFEMWAHAVSLIPVEDWALWDFRRQATRTASWAPPPAVCDRLIGAVRTAAARLALQLGCNGSEDSPEYEEEGNDS